LSGKACVARRTFSSLRAEGEAIQTAMPHGLLRC
jgi:hypothetical protein